MKENLFYAREIVEGVGNTYVRFSTAGNRKHWLSRDKVNRVIVPVNARALVAMQARGVTWEHVDGVSYAKEPKG